MAAARGKAALVAAQPRPSVRAARVARCLAARLALEGRLQGALERVCALEAELEALGGAYDDLQATLRVCSGLRPPGTGGGVTPLAQAGPQRAAPAAACLQRQSAQRSPRQLGVTGPRPCQLGSARTRATKRGRPDGCFQRGRRRHVRWEPAAGEGRESENDLSSETPGPDHLAVHEPTCEHVNTGSFVKARQALRKAWMYSSYDWFVKEHGTATTGEHVNTGLFFRGRKALRKACGYSSYDSLSEEHGTATTGEYVGTGFFLMARQALRKACVYSSYDGLTKGHCDATQSSELSGHALDPEHTGEYVSTGIFLKASQALRKACTYSVVVTGLDGFATKKFEDADGGREFVKSELTDQFIHTGIFEDAWQAIRKACTHASYDRTIKADADEPTAVSSRGSASRARRRRSGARGRAAGRVSAPVAEADGAGPRQCLMAIAACGFAVAGLGLVKAAPAWKAHAGARLATEGAVNLHRWRRQHYSAELEAEVRRLRPLWGLAAVSGGEAGGPAA